MHASLRQPHTAGGIEVQKQQHDACASSSQQPHAWCGSCSPQNHGCFPISGSSLVQREFPRNACLFPLFQQSHTAAAPPPPEIHDASVPLSLSSLERESTRMHVSLPVSPPSGHRRCWLSEAHIRISELLIEATVTCRMGVCVPPAERFARKGHIENKKARGRLFAETPECRPSCAQHRNVRADHLSKHERIRRYLRGVEVNRTLKILIYRVVIHLSDKKGRERPCVGLLLRLLTG